MTPQPTATSTAPLGWLFAPALRPAVLTALLASLLFNASLLVPAMFSLQVFDRVFSSRSVETLAMLGALVLVAIGLGWAMDLLRARSLELAGSTLARVLHPVAMRRALQRRAAPQRAAAEPGDALRDVAVLRGFVAGGGGVVALMDLPWLPLHLLVITLMHPALGAMAAAGAALLVLLGLLTEWLTRGGGEAVQQRSRQAQRVASALLRRAEAVAGQGITDHAVARAVSAQAAVDEAQSSLAARSAALAAAARVLQQLLQAGMLAFGAWLVIAGDASPGIMVAASLLLGRALQPATQLIGGWKKLVMARAAWRRLAEPATAAANEGEHLALPAPTGRLQAERLVFGLGADRQPLIRGVDLELEAGHSLGLIGASGSGKSTLARLLLGHWQPLSGCVRLDGADLARWDRTRLQPHIGYLPQDVDLFPGTVAENIARLGPVDPEAVATAARRAGAHELILRLPQGYDTPVGEGGAALSGGQRQRIGLARALYGAPKLVVLDEPDAHLDSEGQAALMEALAGLKAAGATLIVVTHRRAVLAALDRVALLHEGRLEAVNPVVPQLRTVGARAATA